MWSVVPVIMSSEMPPNTIHIIRAHSLTLKCACTISMVIGTCIRLNYALPYLVLATVFDATAIILSSMSVVKIFIMLTPTWPSSIHLDFPWIWPAWCPGKQLAFHGFDFRCPMAHSQHDWQSQILWNNDNCGVSMFGLTGVFLQLNCSSWVNVLSQMFGILIILCSLAKRSISYYYLFVYFRNRQLLVGYWVVF